MSEDHLAYGEPFPKPGESVSLLYEYYPRYGAFSFIGQPIIGSREEALEFARSHASSSRHRIKVFELKMAGAHDAEPPSPSYQTLRRE